MYEREELSRINLQEYFTTLINDMLSSSGTSGKVSFNLIMETEEIGSKTIAPLALIMTELISNSLKHAFESDGEISIFLGHMMTVDLNFFIAIMVLGSLAKKLLLDSN